MRLPILISILTLASFACGNDEEQAADAPAGNRPAPRIIAGGGIGDGPIDGVANLYVIDDATRAPIAGAAVRVGTLDGTTDATGLFIAEGVVGPQTVTAKAGAYRADVWVGANGANLTMNLVKADDAAFATGVVSGRITGFGAIAVPAGHVKDAVVVASQSDRVGDAENGPPNTLNACYVRLAGQDCAFTLTARTGAIALVAAIYDRDLNGTPTVFEDDTLTLIGWATRRGVTVTGGTTPVPGLDLAPLAAAQLQTVSIDFGAPPPLAFVGAITGLELGAEGVLQLQVFATPAQPTLLVPRLDAVGATAYRLTGIAADGDPATQQSAVIRKGQPGPALAAGAWLAAPSGAAATRGGASWMRVTGATVHSVEYRSGTTHVLTATIFDDATSFSVPDLIAMPSSSLTATINAIGAPGLDVTEFSLDADEDKLVQVGGRTLQID